MPNVESGQELKVKEDKNKVHLETKGKKQRFQQNNAKNNGTCYGCRYDNFSVHYCEY